MPDKIRMGVIGVGGIARGVHIPGILRSPDATLAAVCDIKPEVLDFAREKYQLDGGHTFLNHIDLLKCHDVDAVSICTPNNVHVPIALDAIKYGKPFAVEKPLSVNKEDAKRLYDALKASKTPNMICFSYRFKAAARYARDLIGEGKIGTLRHVYARYLQGWGAPNLNVAKVWRFDKAISGSGTLGDLGSHMLDLVRYLTGDEYVRVVAQNGTFTFERKSADPAKAQAGIMEPVDVDDYSHYFTTMSSGIAASFEITRNGYGRGNYQSVEVYGDEGALIYELENTDTLEACIGEEARNSHKFIKFDIPEKYCVDQMQSFFNRLNGKPDNEAAYVYDGYVNQILLDSIVASSESGKAIDIKY